MIVTIVETDKVVLAIAGRMASKAILECFTGFQEGNNIPQSMRNYASIMDWVHYDTNKMKVLVTRNPRDRVTSSNWAYDEYGYNKSLDFDMFNMYHKDSYMKWVPHDIDCKIIQFENIRDYIGNFGDEQTGKKLYTEEPEYEEFIAWQNLIETKQNLSKDEWQDMIDNIEYINLGNSRNIPIKGNTYQTNGDVL